MEQLVPIEDVAKYFSVSLSTTRKWVRDGVIPSDTYVKVGKTQRFALAKVSEALMAGVANAQPVQPEDIAAEFDPDEDA
jgi:excisionase family DNA binding protein|tara:strand:- start:702 stop:938 length:237 start_codon:yes stop_codon:yes gene_type:complete